MRRLNAFSIPLILALTAPALASPFAIGGTVRTASGEPLAEAQVELLPLLDNYSTLAGILAGPEPSEPAATAVTDASGRYQLEVPASGVWQVVADAPGHVPMLYFLLPLTGSRELPPVTLASDVGGSLQVRDASGAPTPGVLVFAQSASRSFWRQQAVDGWREHDRFGRTDAEGNLALARAEGEELTVVALAPKSVVVARLDSMGRHFRRPLELSTEESATTIEVREADGEPASDVLVAVGDLAQPAGLTDDQGRLVLSGRAEVSIHLFTSDGRSLKAELKEESQARYTLPRRSPITGRVLAAVGRAPVAGAVVWPGADPGRFTFTDEGGSFLLPASATDRFWVQADAAGFLSRVVRPERGGEGWRPLMLTLSAAAGLTGQVIGADGQPVEGARLEAVVMDPAKRPKAFRPDRADGRATSHQDGSFAVAGLHPEAGYRLSASKAGFATAVETTSGLGAGNAMVLLKLLPARTAHGQVVDGEQQPVSGAEVKVVDSADPEGLAVTARTDAAGRFELPELPAPKIDLEVAKDGFPPMNVRGINFPAGREPVDLGVLILEAGVSLTGLVTDVEGEPIVGADVTALAAAEDSMKSLANRRLSTRPVSSDERGRFRVTDLLPDQRIYLVVEKEGYLRGVVPGVEVPAAEESAFGPITVVLRPSSRLAGRVEDEDGLPVAGARVLLIGAGPPPGTVGIRRPGEDNSSEVTSEADGSFEFSGVIPGTVKVGALATDLQPADPQVVEVPAGVKVDDVVLVLERGALLAGVVTDREGEPIGGARLTVGPLLVHSDDDGSYRLGGLSTGLQSLEVRHPQYNRLQQEVEIEPEDNRLDLVLRGGVPVRGKVVDDAGEAIAGAVVELQQRARRDNHDYKTLSDGDGAFQIAAVAGGSYRVAARRDGYASTELAGFEVEDQPIEDLELVLRPGTEIVGSIVGLEFEELSAVEVEAERDGRTILAGVVDYQGRYRVADLAPGDWRVRAWLRGGSREAETRVAVEPGVERLERDLEFGGGLTLVGQVIYGDEPLPQTWVAVRGLDADVERSVTTDWQGRFRVLDLESGRYRLSLSNAREMLVHNEDFELIEDRELVVELATASLRGVVTAAGSGRPLPEAMVYVQQMHGAGGDQPGSLITVATGPRGTFELAQMSAGSYRLRVQKEGFSPDEQRLEIEPGVDVGPLDLVLDPTSGLELRVRLTTGEVPDYVTVSLLDATGVHRFAATRGLDAAGVAQFPTVPEGDWEAVVRTPGAAARSATIQVPGPPLELELTTAGRMRVRVPALVESNRLASLVLTGENGQPFEAVDPSGTPRNRWPLSGGTAVLDGVPPGTWTVEVVATDGQRWWGAGIATAGEESEIRLD